MLHVTLTLAITLALVIVVRGSLSSMLTRPKSDKIMSVTYIGQCKRGKRKQVNVKLWNYCNCPQLSDKGGFTALCYS